MTITISLMPFASASITASLVNAGGTVTTEPSIGAPWCSTAWATVSNTGTPWTSRPSRPGVTPPTIFAPRAVVQALTGQVDGLAAGDPLDDERRVSSTRMLIRRPSAVPWILTTARRAAS